MSDHRPSATVEQLLRREAARQASSSSSAGWFAQRDIYDNLRERYAYLNDTHAAVINELLTSTATITFAQAAQLAIDVTTTGAKNSEL